MSKNAPTGKPRGVRTPVRLKTRQIELFLTRLAETCNVTLACREAGLDFSGLYRLRRRDPAFAAQWAEAVEDGYLRIEGELMQRAMGATDPASPGSPDASTGSSGGPPAQAGAVAGFDPALAFKVLTFQRRADPQGRRSGVRLKQPDPFDALQALERKLTAMEKTIAARKPKP